MLLICETGEERLLSVIYTCIVNTYMDVGLLYVKKQYALMLKATEVVTAIALDKL